MQSYDNDPVLKLGTFAQMKKDKLKKIFENVEVIDTSSEGLAVAKVEDLVVFVQGAVPGDLIDLKITRFKKSFAEGVIERLVVPSPDRVGARCEHFGICGGCKWQHLNYSAQLKFKQKVVYDAFKRIGGIENPVINAIIPSEENYYYRNKLDFTFSSKRWLTKEVIESGEYFDNRNGLGFHLPGLFDKILDINECHLQPSPSNEIRLEIKKYAVENFLPFFDIREKTGFLRTLMIRTSSTGEVMVLVAFFEERKETIKNLLEHIKERFPKITSLLYVINPKMNDTFADLPVFTFSGKDFIEEKMEELRFRVGPKSFYQTNSKQAHQLYKVAREFAQLTGNEVVYDLYTGTGTIANFVASKASRVVGVDYITAAIEDAIINSSVNNISNTRFFSGDMKDVFTDHFVSENGKPDVIITDPPRAGMHEDVNQVILNSGAKRVVYVSCNPATQARDLISLSKKYELKKTQPVDMFPHTHHVENIILLELRN